MQNFPQSRSAVKRKPAHGKRLDFDAFRTKDREGERPAQGRMDISFFFLIIVLQTLGLIMLFSASYVTALQENQNSLYYVTRQTFFAAVGLVFMIGISYFNYHWIRKFVWLGYIAGLVLMVAALFFKNEHGANRWIAIGPITFQPSEIMKFIVVLLFSHLIAINYKRMKQLRYGFFPFMIVLAPVLGLLVLQRHLSGLLIVLAIACLMMFIAGSKLRWFAALAAIGGVVLLLFAMLYSMIKGEPPFSMFSYVGERFQNWLSPLEGDITGSKWQTAQGLYAIGSGGLMGVGLGNSTQKHLYVSEPMNDMIFSIICEELGFVGAMVVILLFVLFVYVGFTIAMRAPDKFGCMLAMGLTLQVGVQALLNIAVVTNAFPNTGVSLPFFSSGGTALLMLLAQMGVILNISRYARKPVPKTQEEPSAKSDDRA